MTKSSAFAGPLGLRRAALPAIVATAIQAWVVHPGLADPGDLTSPSSSPSMALGSSGAANQPPAFPTFLDHRRLQVMERHTQPRFEALALRRAEKLKRRAIEADLKRKAEEMRRSVEAASTAANAPNAPRDTLVTLISPAPANAAPVAAPAPRNVSASVAPMRAAAGLTLPFLSAPAKPSDPADCSPGSLTTTALPGGRVAIDISEPCRKDELVTIRYAPYVFMRALDAGGRLRFVLDLFQGPDPAVAVVFASGETKPVAIGVTDIDRVSKVAVIWGKPVNLDLHVFEYAATSGSSGHVWTKSPSDAEAARDASARTQRGRGYLSFASDGTQPGHQVEVYTLWHHPGQSSGVVATALDYETRAAATGGPSCSDGELAEIQFETITIAPRRPPTRERGIIPRAACGDAQLEKARYQDDAIADLPVSLE